MSYVLDTNLTISGVHLARSIKKKPRMTSANHDVWLIKFRFQNSYINILNGILFSSLNHAKIFDSILDEPRSTSSWELGKLHAQ